MSLRTNLGLSLAALTTVLHGAAFAQATHTTTSPVGGEAVERLRLEDIAPPRLNDPGQLLPLINNPQIQQLVVPFDVPQALEVAVSLNGEVFTVKLTQHAVLAPGATVTLGLGPDQQIELDPGPTRTYKGEVAGRAGSLATATLFTGGRLSARIDLGGGEVWQIEELTAMGPGQHVAYREQDAAPLPANWCGTVDDPQATTNPVGGGFSTRSNEVFRAFIALECDTEFFENWGGDSMTEMLAIFNDVQAIYTTQLSICFIAPSVQIWGPGDPYSSDDANTLLQQVRNRFFYTAPYSTQFRHAVQLFSGRDLDGSTVGLGGSGGINYCGPTTVPWSGGPTENVAAGWTSRWNAVSLFEDILLRSRRVEVSAHELGHNWSATHCDGDQTCGIMNSTVTLYPGSGRTQFGETSANQIIARRNAISQCARDCSFNFASALCSGHCQFGTPAAAHAGAPVGGTLRIYPSGRAVGGNPRWNGANFVWNRPMLLTAPSEPVILGQ